MTLVTTDYQRKITQITLPGTRVIQKKKRLEGDTQNDNNAPTDVLNEDDNIEKVDPLFAKPEAFVTR